MKKVIIATICGAIVLQIKLTAQDNTEKLSVKLGGYVRFESYYDTYQSVDSRDGDVYYYPKRAMLDATGKDINNTPQFEMIGVQSRMRITGSGTTVLNAKASGLLESDFTGTSEDYKFLLRLRHAMIKLDWEKTQLLVGQWWHPMDNIEFNPNTVLNSSGITYQPLIRSAQIRVTQQFATKLKLIGALLSHTYHRSKEIAGYNSQRNSGLPDMQLQLQYGNVNAFFFSLTGGYKFLKPYLTTTDNSNTYKATKIVGSYNLQACLGYQFTELSAKFEGNLGQNMSTYNMIGGYSPVAGSANYKGEYDFANMTTMSLWSDFETKGEKLKFGLFAGFSKNLGSRDSLTVDERLCRDSNLKQIFRISPRICIYSGNVDFGIEYILTGAIYGTYMGKSIKNTDHATVDQRFLISARYNF